VVILPLETPKSVSMDQSSSNITTYQIKVPPANIRRHPDSHGCRDEVEQEPEDLHAGVGGHGERARQQPHQNGSEREEDDKSQARHDAVDDADLRRHVPVNVQPRHVPAAAKRVQVARAVAVEELARAVEAVRPLKAVVAIAEAEPVVVIIPVAAVDRHELHVSSVLRAAVVELIAPVARRAEVVELTLFVVFGKDGGRGEEKGEGEQ
jgi:hypothetical protein